MRVNHSWIAAVLLFAWAAGCGGSDGGNPPQDGGNPPQDGGNPPQEQEVTITVDALKVPGSYAGSDGYAWTFASDQTGTCSIFNGVAFRWSVAADTILVSFNNGFQIRLLVLSSTRSSAGGYTLIVAGFTEYWPNGSLYADYGRHQWTRQ